MRVLLTGGHGLVGRPLTRLLRAAGHDVLALDLPSVAPESERLDVTDAAALAVRCASFRPEHVAHLAAWTDVDGCEREPAKAERANAQGARNVAKACAAVGAPMLYVSTDYVYDGAKRAPYTVDDAVLPLSHYGRSKLAGEFAVQLIAPEWRIVRCQSIYGHGKKSLVDFILDSVDAGRPLRGVTDQTVTPSYAEDVAAALLAVLERAAPGLYLASNAGSCTGHGWVSKTLELAGRGDVEVAACSMRDFDRPAARPAHSVFDLTALTAATGHTPRAWDAALADYIGRRGEEGR